MAYIKLFSRPYTAQYCEICLRMSAPEVAEHVAVTARTFMVYPDLKNEGEEILCMEENDWKEFLAAVEKGYSSVADRRALIESFHRYGKEYVEVSQRIGTTDIGSLSAGKVVSLYEEYFTAWVAYTAYLWMTYLLNDILAARAEQVLSTKHIDHSREHEIVTTLLSPVERGGILRLQDELSEFKRQGVKQLPPEKVASVLKEYAWMPCLDVQNDPWTEEDVAHFYEQLEPVSDELVPFDQAADSAGLSQDERELFAQVREVAYVKDVRDVYRRQGTWHIIPFYGAMARYVGTTRPDLVYYTSSELMKALREGTVVPADEIERRKRGFMMQWQGEVIRLTTDAREIAEFGKKFRSEEVDTTISGISAARGQVRGRVAIVRGVGDLKKVTTGDVLVAVTTHPDFLPAMQRAAAFVTDEGGLTSHAAIVAREMHKPCIVGTKNATKVLKDGDEVEVDADKGIVRRL